MDYCELSFRCLKPPSEGVNNMGRTTSRAKEIGVKEWWLHLGKAILVGTEEGYECNVAHSREEEK